AVRGRTIERVRDLLGHVVDEVPDFGPARRRNAVLLELLVDGALRARDLRFDLLDLLAARTWDRNPDGVPGRSRASRSSRAYIRARRGPRTKTTPSRERRGPLPLVLCHAHTA